MAEGDLGLVETDDPVPPQLEDFPKVAFDDWKRHPATKIVMGYLADALGAIRAAHMERWEADAASDLNLEAHEAGRVNTIKEVINIEYIDLLQFYQDQNKEKHEPEASKD